MRPLVESLIALDEALQRGLQAIETTQRQTTQNATAQMLAALDQEFGQMSAWRRWRLGPWHARAKELCRQQVIREHSKVFEALLEGYQLISSRLERDLSTHQIRLIDCVGRPFDPKRMTAVGLVDDAEAEPETVVEEVRPGYLWRGEVLRFAEVRVARGDSSRGGIADRP
jgi:hypothetical protein